MAENKTDIKNDIQWRVSLCYIGMLLMAVMLIFRIGYIQYVQGRTWRAMGDSLHLTYVDIPAQRGSILSEDGNILSTSIPEYDIYMDFRPEGLREKDGKRFHENVDSLSLCLSQLFSTDSVKISKEAYESMLADAFKKKTPRLLIKRKISYDQMNALKKFPLFRDGKNKSGLLVENRDKRINPYVLLANRTIGLSRKDSTKNVGLERTYDSLLRGTPGQRLLRYAAGSYIPVEGAEVDPVNGKDIITTLDTYMQDVAENELMSMLVNNNSLHGTVIVMETATGKIKAIANLGKEGETMNYTENLNYGIAKATEPGSVFKLVTLLSLLEDKFVTNESMVDCEGGLKYFYGLRIKDSHKGTGVISVKDAFMRSSNVAFAKLADQYYGSQPIKWWEHIDRFRLNKMTGIDIVASSGMPYIKKPGEKNWQKTTIPFMAHGYEELVTPLHMLMLYNSVANNGRMMKPYLVNSVREHGMDVQTFSPQVLVDKICSEQTIAQAKVCLAAVVDSLHGTAHKVLFDSAYRISGKTGTAVTALNNKGYNKGNKVYQSSFIGYFPTEAPKYTMAVVIQNTEKSVKYYGADVAGAVFKKISDKIYYRYVNKTGQINYTLNDTTIHNYYGMRSDLLSIFSAMNVKFSDSNSKSLWSQSNILHNNASMKGVTDTVDMTPNVTGMGLKDALYLLEQKGYNVVFTGKGRVVTQSIPAGKSIIKGEKIILMLN